MEIVLTIIMILVTCGFVLRMTCHGRIGRIVWCAVAALFVVLACDAATGQSKTRIADWLSQPELMLDMSVWLTVDVAFQICFCVLAAKACGGSLSRTERAAFRIVRWMPGLLIFPVLFAVLTELIFSFPGADFSSIAWGMAIGLPVVMPLLSAGLHYLIPETDIRLEMIFMINLLVAALGIVATVNGRTAAVGTNTVEWPALAGVAGILLAGLFFGMIFNRYLTCKTISKIK